MFSTFIKKPKKHDLSWLAVDIHSHLLPGIDDGARHLGEAVTYIRALRELGISSFYATPHVFMEVYPNTTSTIISAHQKLVSELRRNQLPVQLFAAAEYMANGDFEAIYTQENLLCLPGKHVLIEMSYLVESWDIQRYIFELQIRGYTPIFAHPERYIYYHDRPERYHQLKDQGCLFQVNLLSAAGYYGSRVKHAALSLIKWGMVDFAGTDLHHERHLAALERFVRGGDAYRVFKPALVKNEELFATTEVAVS